jgi:uncharacterized protein (TIGR03067 family)
MHRRLAVALVALIALTAFAPVPFPRPDKKNSSLQGTWTLVTQTRNGTAVAMKGVAASTRRTVRIEGDKWFPRREGLKASKSSAGYTILLDNSKNPKWIDLKRPTDGRVIMQGIYKAEGDTLKILYTLGGAASNLPRPTSFTETTEGRQILMTLKRGKP